MKKVVAIVSLIFALAVTIIAVIWLIDYINVKNSKSPILCLSEEEIVYDNGKVYVCNGLLYKVYTYDRETIKGTEFGPFFMKIRE